MKKSCPTEVGLLAIWNAGSFRDIDSLEKYRANFVSDNDILKLINDGRAVVWSTGGDGIFDIELRVNPSEDLFPEEVDLVEMKSLNLKFTATGGPIFVGSPEVIGGEESLGLSQAVITTIDGITAGNYLVNLYFIYDPEPDELSRIEYDEKIKIDPNFDRNGQIIVLKKVPDDYVFPVATTLPQLG